MYLQHYFARTHSFPESAAAWSGASVLLEAQARDFSQRIPEGILGLWLVTLMQLISQEQFPQELGFHVNLHESGPPTEQNCSQNPSMRTPVLGPIVGGVGGGRRRLQTLFSSQRGGFLNIVFWANEVWCAQGEVNGVAPRQPPRSFAWGFIFLRFAECCYLLI